MPRGITEQDVFEAADALLTRGERPTIERVRQELGSGSPNTINPHLDAWWIALGKRVGGVQGGGLPPAVLQAATKFYQDLKGQALAESANVVAEQQRMAQEARRDAEASQALFTAEKAGLQSTIEALRGELARISESAQGLSRQLAQQHVELTNAQHQAQEAQLQLKTAQDEHGRAAAAARMELERVREQGQANQGRWLREIDHLREDGKRIRTESDRVQKLTQKRIEDLEQQLSAGAKDRAALRASLDTAQRELASEREKRNFAEGALSASQKRAKPGTLVKTLRRHIPKVST